VENVVEPLPPCIKNLLLDSGRIWWQRTIFIVLWGDSLLRYAVLIDMDKSVNSFIFTTYTWPDSARLELARVGVESWLLTPGVWSKQARSRLRLQLAQHYIAYNVKKARSAFCSASGTSIIEFCALATRTRFAKDNGRENSGEHKDFWKEPHCKMKEPQTAKAHKLCGGTPSKDSRTATYKLKMFYWPYTWKKFWDGLRVQRPFFFLSLPL
jgi:hypothetical protein